MAGGGTDRNPIEVLSEEFLERLRRGEAVTPEGYAAEHPELADEILALFPALLMMEELGDETSDRTSSSEGESGTTVGATAGRLGEFRLLREVGRGGMGVVYEAEQESLGRRVALKILPNGALTDEKQVRRFEREARSAARLHHTNIVPIFGVGEHEGTHFYVMQFIQGQGLDAVLGELKKLRDLRATKSVSTMPPERQEKSRGAAADIAQSLVTGRFVPGPAASLSRGGAAPTEAWTSAATTPSSSSAAHSDISIPGAGGASSVTTLTETDRRFALGVARIGVQVAEALAHAHGQGILHRDIKPSNLLLDREGKVWVTDFGLAKATGGDDLTHTGDIIGTVRYMAPERFKGSGDARADLYALGLTLYEMLALRPAFDETDRASLVRQVTQEDPPRLRRLNRYVPPDLETIIHKTIARDPGHRYQTARALSEDLERYLDGRPILARQVSTTERLYRWSRRNPALATAISSLVLVLLATTVGSVLAAARFRNIAEAARIAAVDADVARNHADASRQLAEAARLEAEVRRKDADAQRQSAQASLAESRASLALARKAVDDSFTKVSESALVNVPGLRPLRRELLQSSLAFYEEFVRRGGDDPGALADLAATQARVGQILSDLGEKEKSRAALRRAVELYEKTLVARPDDLVLLERQSEVWHRLGDLDYATDAPAANQSYSKAIAIRKRLAARSPAEPRFRMALSRSYNGMALTSSGENQFDAYRRSLELRLKLAGEIPDDPDLLHGLSESFLNLATLLERQGNRQEALELANHAIDYGRAGLARRSHDLEFATDLAVAYSFAVSLCARLGRREDALNISTDSANYLRKLTTDNPDVPSYRDMLANALVTHGELLHQIGRKDDAVVFRRQSALVLESRPDPDAAGLYNAAYYRARNAALLAGDPVAKPVNSWPESARREADLAVADLKAAIARGFRRAEFIRGQPLWTAVLTGDELKSLLAEMERPPANPPLAASQTVADSPLHQAGRLDEDRLLGELTIALIESAKGTESNRAQLESMMARIDASRKANPDSPILEQSAQSIRMSLAEQFWKSGELAKAMRLWDELLAPFRRLSAEDSRRKSAVARLEPALRRMTELCLNRGLWEHAAEFDDLYRLAPPEVRSFRSYDSGMLALLRNDVAKYREIVAESFDRFADSDDFWMFNVLRTATLIPNAGAPFEKLIAMGERLVAKGRGDGWYGWYQVALANALFRADRDEKALAALDEQGSYTNGKPIVALIHARAGRREQAERWLRAIDRDLEQDLRGVRFTMDAGRQPQFAPLDILRADLLRREAYALLKQTAPEIASLRLLRADGFWRLDEKSKAETEFAAAVTGAQDQSAALTDRARAFESLGIRDRALADLAEAARRSPKDPRPWVERGKLLCERGQGLEADAAYTRAAELAPGRLDPFLEAGWWFVGPYPEDMNLPQPPELDPDPARPVAGEAGVSLNWKPAIVNEDRNLLIGHLAGRPNSSVYALTHVASDRERTTVLCLAGRERVRLWLNGRLVYDDDRPHTYRPGPEVLVPITLRTGRNTLLVRLRHRTGYHSIRVRSDDFELDHSYLLAEFGRWAEAADFFDRADAKGECLHPWSKARQIELLAALGDRDRYLRAAARLADWDGAIRSDPAEVARALGIMPNELLSPDRLIELAQQGVALNPSDAWRKVALGLAYYRAGRDRRATECLSERALEQDRLASPIVAMAHWRLGEKEQARKALAGVDGSFEAWCRERAGGRGTAWLTWWSDGPQLVALRREAHALINGHAPDDTMALAHVRAEMGNLIDDRDSPTWAYDLVLQLEPGNAPYLQALALRLLELGRPAEADRALAASIAGKTDQPQAWVDRGLALAGARLPDRAAADFAHALELLPDDFDIWGARSKHCFLMAGQTAALERVLAVRPSDALLWYVRGEKHLIGREYKEAVADFVRGGEPPATTEFAYIYAAALLLSGDESGYRDYVVRLASRHGDESVPNTLFVLARLAMLSDRPPVPPDEIVRWASRALELIKPQTAWYRHVQAMAFLRAGDFEAALKSVQISRSLGWSSAGQVLNDFVEWMILNRQGRSAQAKVPFERIRAIFDSTPTAHFDNAVQLTDWLEFRILMGQIEGPLLDAAFPVNPFAR
jgi:eukaryotic-like serine/threonine-protein kinase